jgi:penicillin-binding protein 1A
MGGRQKSRKRKSSPLWWRWTKRFGALTLLILLMGSVVAGVFFMIAFRKAGDKIDALATKLDQIETPATVMYARDGQTLLYRASSQYRKLINTYDEIPKLVIDATLAAEDKRFFDHRGVDPIAVGRSLFRNVAEGRQAQGGSTITMQLSKRLFTSTEKSFERKLEDAALAMQIERKLTKKEILRAYLNQVYYGQGAYGIRAAADVYFGKKSLDKLTPSEAAMLARMVRRPSQENPFSNLKVAVRNRDVVLRIMRDEGMLSAAEYEKAVSEEPKLRPKSFGSGERIYAAPYFTRYVLDTIAAQYPDVDLGTAGWTIITTLDFEMQTAAEKAVQDLVKKYQRRKVTAGAFVLLDDKGQILAMQGNTNWERDEYNVIAQGRRQPGSAFKPFIYAAALSTGAISPGDRVSNEAIEWRDPASGKVWRPRNSGGGAGGTFSIPAAIANSKNLPAVHVSFQAGLDTCARYARDVFGFKSPIQPFRSMALGVNEVSPLEMAQGYSVFMLRGDRVTPYGIAQIVGADKSIVRTYEPKIVKHILDERVAAYMDACLRGVVTGGTGRAAGSIKDARGKTGTTQEARDAWFCGYTNNLIGIGWIANVIYDKDGNARYQEMSDSVFGGTVTVEMWRDVMKVAQKKRGTGTARDVTPLMRDLPVEGEGAVKPPETVTPPTVVPDDAVPDPPSGTDTDQRGTDTSGSGTVANPPTQSEPPRTDPPTRTESEGEMVSVEICADSGQKATIYCPETVTRRYKSADAPRRWCRKHSP